MIKSVIISGGGTGGHIFPAIAIADELKRRHPELEIEFVGAADRMEMQRVPAAGYPITGLWISGIVRTKPWKNALFPFKLISSLWKSWKLLKKRRPVVAIGTGGFASGPLLYMASRMGIPTVIQEQNSFPGITNKILAGRVKLVCVAFEGLEKYFPKEKIKLTGNPIRQDILNSNLNKNQARETFGLDPDKITILVTGGSLGAKSINESVKLWVNTHFDSDKHQIIWQTGSAHAEYYVSNFGEKKGIWISAFIDDMAAAYKAADIVIARAGAGTLSELCALGKASVLIPSPWVAEDHQRKNAESLREKNAAIVVDERAIERFPEELQNLLENTQLRESIEQNALNIGKPKATEEIVSHIEKLLQL